MCYQFCSEIYSLQEQMSIQIFREWQDQKALKICTIEPGGLFKDIGVDVQELTASIEIMNAKSLNFERLSKFVQQVANKSGG